jgi:hypothetical protein
MSCIDNIDGVTPVDNTGSAQSPTGDGQSRVMVVMMKEIYIKR